MGFFYLESSLLISSIFGFLFFAKEHIYENTKPMQNYHNFVFRVVCSGHNSQSVAQSYQGALTVGA